MSAARNAIAKKYIVTKTEAGKEQVYVFDSDITHADFLEGIQAIRHGAWKSQGRSVHFDFCRCIAGGFFNGVTCHGNSESIGVKSRGEVDTALILGPLKNTL